MRRAIILASAMFLVCYANSCVAEDPAQQTPVPNHDAISAAKQKVGEIFRDRYQAARSDKEKVVLAQKLFGHAMETRNDDAAQYALLEISADIAGGAGAADIALRAIDELERRFAIDALVKRTDVLSTAAKGSRTAPQLRALIPLVIESMEACVAADRYALAMQLGDTGQAVAVRVKDRELGKTLGQQLASVRRMERDFSLVQDALETLQTSPTDTAANQRAGRFYCFVKGDWEKGLSFLALGGDSQLTQLATKELAVDLPVVEQVKLADAWWSIAAEMPEATRSHLLDHAAGHYRDALPELSGLDKLHVEQRLAEHTLSGPAETVTRPARSSRSTGRGKIVDLLSLVEPDRRLTSSGWKNEANLLAVDVPQGAHLFFPVDIEGDYDMHIEFTRHRGLEGINVIFPVGDRNTMILVDTSPYNGGFTYIASLDGKSILENPQALKGSQLKGNRRFAYDIAVRRAGENGAVAMAINGAKAFTWQGKLESLTLPDSYLKYPNVRLGFTFFNGAFSIHSVQLRSVGGTVALQAKDE